MNFFEILSSLATMVEMGLATPAQTLTYDAIVALGGSGIALVGIAAYNGIRRSIRRATA